MSEKNIVGPWMKRDVVSIKPSATIREAVSLLTKKRVGTLPVVDDSGKLVGLTTMNDILKLFLPDFLSLMENVDFVKDYGVLRELSPQDIQKADALTVGDIMGEPCSIEQDSSLVRALSVMKDHELGDLPVLQNDELVGVVSHVDIGRALLENYLKVKKVNAT